MNFNHLTASMEAMVLYPNYYRMHGIRRAVQLVAPPIRSTAVLQLPKESILHSLPEDEAAYGIPQDDIIFHGLNKVPLVDHITTLSSGQGNPRPTRVPPIPMIRQYHRAQRGTRWLRNREIGLRDPNSVIVENYGLLPHLYRYPITYLRSYHKWFNIQTTIWTQVGVCAKESNRQQYLVVRLPKMIPSRQALMRAAASMNRTTLKQVGTPDTLFLLELWKWIGEQRDSSVLSKAGAGIRNMNLIFLDHGQWSMLNLGLLDSWREDPKIKSSEQKPGLIPAKMLQNRFLRLMAMMVDERTVEDTAVKGSVATAEPKILETTPPGKQQDEETTVDGEVVELRPIKIVIPQDKGGVIKISLKKNQDIEHLPESHPIEETAENIKLIDEAIDRELKAMDDLHEEMIARDDLEDHADEHEMSDDRIQSARDPFEQPIIKYSKQKRNPKEAFAAKVDAMADAGSVSAPEYRRLSAMAGAYEKISNPYGGAGTLAEAMVVDPSSLVIKEGTTLPKTEGVFDSSMGKSTLEVFDSAYVKDVLSKDILRSVVGLQSAGVAVTGYAVETIEDAMGIYEAHTVQLTPAQGRPSTVHFRVPKVQEDGTFRANGVRYRLRKQRGDLPIRKVAPDKVALTSYYSKTFVSRSEKQANNYAGWLTNQIAAQGIDPNNTLVTEAMMADVFDSNWQVPRIYSTLAMRFRSFKIGNIELYLDYDRRYEHFGEELVKSIEKPGTVVIGRHSQTKALVVVDQHNQMFAVKGDKIEELGVIESWLNLSGRPPMEVAELKVFGKQIPLGICLGYLMGFNNLMQLMQVQPRRVGAGERVSLSEDEFAVRFEDVSLVFNRENRLATLVFGGFLTIEESTRNYPIHLFDKKDIYLNALQPQRLGLRYLKELDLENDLFIDPITEEILAEMREPTQYPELLLRAAELLVTDYAPDESDMSVMRIKGYERVAGTVYGEMVKALRLYRARGAAVNAKIEIPPYAIWQAITQDPAVKLVEESNPIHNLKEKEEVTYSGAGGRTGRSMTKRTRLFHPNDLGVISEATKDSADVSITTFMTADPQLVNLRGVTRAYDRVRDGSAAAVSTAMLVSPASDRDD